jgi:hypothetical protein
VPQFLRVAFVALLAAPFAGFAFFGSDSGDDPQTTAIETIASAPVVSMAMQEPVASGKADREPVKAEASSSAIPDKTLMEQTEAIAAPPELPDELPHQVTAARDIGGTVEAEAQVAASVATELAADDPAEEPAATKPTGKKKKVVTSRAKKKKAATKQRIAKTRDADKPLSVPLVLVPPQKIGSEMIAQPEITDDSAKPVAEEAKRVRQNFGPSGTNEQFRRK